MTQGTTAARPGRDAPGAVRRQGRGSAAFDGSGGRLRGSGAEGTEGVASSRIGLRPFAFARTGPFVLLLACGDGAPDDRPGPLDPGVGGPVVVVARSVLDAADAPCGEIAAAGTTRRVCAGDSVDVGQVAATVDVRLEGPDVLPFAIAASPGDTATVWLLRREHEEALEYVTQLVNVSGSRPFPFGPPALPVAVELEGVEPTRRDAFRETLERLDDAVSSWTGGETFVFVTELPDAGLRLVGADLGEEDGRSFAETFTAGHKLVCRIEVEAGLNPGPALSARIAHEVGHCLGLTRHDPLDTPGRLMHRLAPPESWTAGHGPAPFDALVLALAARASEHEIRLARFR